MCSISGKTGNSSLSLSLSRPAAHTTQSQLGTRHSLCSAYRRAYGVGSIDYLAVLRQLLPFCTQRTHVGAVDHRCWCCEQAAPRNSIGRDLRGRCAYHRVTDMLRGPSSKCFLLKKEPKQRKQKERTSEKMIVFDHLINDTQFDGSK